VVEKGAAAAMPYNFAMKVVKSCINDHGCRGGIVEYQHFSPLDYWLRKNVFEGGQALDFHTYIHGTRTIAVNCFFQSTDEADGPTLRRRTDWPVDSLWFQVLEASKQAANANRRIVVEDSATPPTVTVGGILRDPHSSPPGAGVGTSTDTENISAVGDALKRSAAVLQQYLNSDDQLHFASVCKGVCVPRTAGR
jgi:hypothetical protein